MPQARRILLLEDDVDLAVLLKDLLEADGFGVALCSDANQGFREMIGQDFDLVLCDLMLPGMGGDLFFRQITQTHPEMVRRFIFLTGHSDNPKIAQFVQDYGTQVLYKPIGLAELMKKINSALGER